MSARIRADIFAAGLIRRANAQGAFAALRRRGAAEAGAIFVLLDRLDGSVALFGPVPQSEVEDDGMRRLARLHREEWIEPLAAEAKIQKEIAFDGDLWLVEIEDRQGRDFTIF